jgi:hypothetical protein
VSKLLALLVIVMAGTALSGCSYCDWPLYVPNSCSSPPAPPAR